MASYFSASMPPVTARRGVLVIEERDITETLP
jgi:hypothetical protein